MNNVATKEAVLTEKVSVPQKPECCAPIPGMDKIWDYAGTIIAVLMAGFILVIAFALRFIFSR